MFEGDDKKEEKEKALSADLNMTLFSEDESYVDVTITFTLEEQSKEYVKNVPIVRILK